MTTVNIQPLQSSPLRQLSFAVRLPETIFRGPGDDPAVGDHGNAIPSVNPALRALLYDTGIVGTITVMKKAAMVWFGWGKFDLADATNASAEGTARKPRMGPLMVAMPRTQYQGAFASGRGEASSTKLVGSADEDEELLCRQMASLLSGKLGMSIFCSCSLKMSGADALTQGVDPALLQHQAAALAEKEVYRLLVAAGKTS